MTVTHSNVPGQYQHFVGIDIASKEFVVAVFGQKDVSTHKNTASGWKKFLHQYQELLSQNQGLVVLESTGGYERALLHYLLEHEVVVHRADTRKVKNFIRSYGQYGKTDALDAHAIARYGYERQAHLLPYQRQSALQEDLRQLVERRADLVAMCSSEKNRAQAPGISLMIRKNIDRNVAYLTDQIKEIEGHIKELIQSNPSYVQKKEILCAMPGIGETTAHALLAFLPELGTTDRRHIASLVGLADRKSVV